ncbi:UNVERIFIED_CONTAM: hypothetical protein HHA_452630 [Hammondia hammondi]|eukprot:XP_008885819.1 hypothetical protein HHA_452630 [Hammondia hammondi]
MAQIEPNNKGADDLNGIAFHAATGRRGADPQNSDEETNARGKEHAMKQRRRVAF